MVTDLCSPLKFWLRFDSGDYRKVPRTLQVRAPGEFGVNALFVIQVRDYVHDARGSSWWWSFELILYRVSFREILIR